MAVIKAFGKWETEKLDGNPYAKSGTVKVYMNDPKIPLILDTIGEQVAFIAVRVASSNRFALPKANRSDAEKKRAVYYAIYTPAAEWNIIDGGYSPSENSAAEQLTKELIPQAQNNAVDPVQEESKNTNAEALKSLIANSEDTAPYTSFPLTQRQMLEQAAYLMKLSVEDYIESEIPPKRRQWAYGRFGIDVPASA